MWHAIRGLRPLVSSLGLGSLFDLVARYRCDEKILKRVP